MKNLSRKMKSLTDFSPGNRLAVTIFLQIAICTVLIFSVTPGVAQAKTLTLGHTVPPSHVWHKVAVRFADNLAKASGRQDEAEGGSAAESWATNRRCSAWPNPAPFAFTILPAGFSFQSGRVPVGLVSALISLQDVKEAGEAVKLPAADQMLKKLERHGVIGVGYLFAGQRHVLSVKEVKTPADLVNKKIPRLPQPHFQRLVAGQRRGGHRPAPG